MPLMSVNGNRRNGRLQTAIPAVGLPRMGIATVMTFTRQNAYRGSSDGSMADYRQKKSLRLCSEL